MYLHAMKRILYLFALISVFSCGHPQRLELDEFTSFKKAVLDIDGKTVNVTSSSTEAGIVINGHWDLTPYRAVRFTIENKDTVHPIQVYAQVIDSTCLSKGFTRAVVRGKADFHAALMPLETGTFELCLPEPMPHTEVNDIFYDNFIGPRVRNTPYSRAYGQFSYKVDLKNIISIGIGATILTDSVRFAISDVSLIPGKRNSLPEYMSYGKDRFFPFIDKYGQFKHATWPGKVDGDDDLLETRKKEEKDLAGHPSPKEWSKFGGWTAGPRFEATGHFYVKKIDGKWWMIDPEGYLFWSHGVVRVTPSCAVTPLDGHKFYFEDLPQEESDPLFHFYFTRDELLHHQYTARGIKETYDFSCANIYRKYGEGYRETWYDLAHRRLRSWGLNTIANSSDQALCLMDRTAYNDRVALASPIEGYPEWPFLEGSTGWWKFIDPFDPIFEECVRAHLEINRKKLEDPWCMGYFIDNEIQWGTPDHLAALTIKAPESQASKKVFILELKGKYGNICNLNKAWGSSFKSWDALAANREDAPEGAYQDLCGFSLRIVEKYFCTVRSEFKKIAPQVLYMGCRFSNAPEFVARIAANYCDVMSYNRYAFDMASFSLPEGIDVPVMIGEFHFGSLDRGLFHSGLLMVNDQKQRGEMYKVYLKSCLKNPSIIGTNWHQFSDQPTSGRFDGENFQVGFTDVCDKPYEETVKALRSVGSNMYEIRMQADGN